MLQSSDVTFILPEMVARQVQSSHLALLSLPCCYRALYNQALELILISIELSHAEMPPYIKSEL